MRKGLEKLRKCNVCKSNKIKFAFKCKEDLIGKNETFSMFKCSNCNLYFLNPRPNSSTIMKYYPDDYFAYGIDYNAASLKSRLGLFLYKKLFTDKINIPKLVLFPLKKFMMGLIVKKDAKVLDVGTGAGGWLLVINKLGMEGYGLDPCKKAIKLAKKHGLKVKAGTLQSSNYPDNFFDIITLYNVIEHVHNPLEDLRELKRILKPGGTLIIYTPNTGSLFFKTTKENWPHLGAPQHLNLFSTKTLDICAKKIGFQCIQKRYMSEPRMIVLGSYIWFRRKLGLKIKSKKKSRLYNNQFSCFYLLPLSWIIDSLKLSEAIEVYFRKPLG